MVDEPNQRTRSAGYFHLFLSHISAEKTYVSEVATALREYGVEGFVAHEDITPTDDWQRSIEAALGSCDALAAFLHPGFQESIWTNQEIGFVMARRILVLPIRLGIDPPGFLGRVQALAGDREPTEMAASIFSTLRSSSSTRMAIAGGITQAVEDAPNYTDARKRVAIAESIEHWTSEQLGQLEAAIDKNRQVRESSGVPERIRRIIARQRELTSSATRPASRTGARAEADQGVKLRVIDRPEQAPPSGVTPITLRVTSAGGVALAAARVRATAFSGTFQQNRNGQWSSLGQSWAGETSGEGTVTMNVTPQPGAEAITVEFESSGVSGEISVPVGPPSIRPPSL